MRRMAVGSLVGKWEVEKEPNTKKRLIKEVNRVTRRSSPVTIIITSSWSWNWNWADRHLRIASNGISLLSATSGILLLAAWASASTS